jgi:hypothetical protein
MTYRTLVHELGREQLKTTKELLDIATRHASDEEVVGAVFVQGGHKVVLSGGRGTSAIATHKGTKRGIKSDKRGPRQWLWRVTVTSSCDEEMNGRDTGDTDERDFKRPTRSPTDHFEKLLDATSPNHKFPVKHKLKECSMMKN